MAQNRSAQNYKMERTPYSFWEFYDPGTPDCNEYIARCEIGKALVHSVYGYTDAALEVERRYSYNRHLPARMVEVAYPEPLAGDGAARCSIPTNG